MSEVSETKVSMVSEVMRLSAMSLASELREVSET